MLTEKRWLAMVVAGAPGSLVGIVLASVDPEEHRC